ncbi:hypothetical protein KIKIMORA_04460 [Brevundimonas phage vB_BpoS-Kikimora]|uniref:Uncharacterized protein n=1 Tax=Brevundimonas phage vB_BpoS-Kikimora TaxID=2948601 RepID=A0A9E7SLH8_9CAUD|nr:hypothetical protein KIKIMORA_04460 [Brevundimonas phage vB_BpoS-Kikimora]
MNDHNVIVNEKALEMALRYHAEKGSSADDIVDTAKIFTAFLTSTPETKA